MTDAIWGVMGTTRQGVCKLISVIKTGLMSRETSFGLKEKFHGLHLDVALKLQGLKGGTLRKWGHRVVIAQMGHFLEEFTAKCDAGR